MMTHTTRLLRTRWTALRQWLAHVDPWHGAALIVLGLALAATAQPRPAAAPAPSPVPPPPAPTAAVAPPTAFPIREELSRRDSRPALPRAVGAFDAPGGAYLGAIEPDRPCALIARSGVDWLQIDCAGSGQVWTPARDYTGLPDLATPQPTPAPAAPVIAVAHSQPVVALSPVPVQPTLPPTIVSTDTHGPVTITLENRGGVTVSRAYIAPDAPRLCMGFQDWRDYDPMYAASPVCRPPK